VALALVSVAASACGGAADPSAKNDQKDKFLDAALKHARCMRQNGIDFPDPQGDKGGVRMDAGGKGGKDNPKVRRALDKCQHFIDEATPVISQEERAQIEQQELAHARCMRAQGINLPDPRVDSRGRVQFLAPRGAKPDKPAFERAREKCRKAGGDGGPKLAGPGK
jgi:hypothetical protein